MKRSVFASLAITVAVVVLTAFMAACGGGGNSAAPGAVVCDDLASEAYLYTVHAVRTVEPLPPPATPPPGGLEGMYTFKEDIDGRVEASQIYADITNDLDGSVLNYQAIQLNDNVAYLNYNRGLGWQGVPTDAKRIPLKYRPPELCSSLAPDIDTTKLGTGVAEAVNGVPSHKYTFTDFSSTFFSRLPDYGPLNDLALNGPSFDGAVWIADDGSFISKLDITGTSHYPSGQAIVQKITFEISDLGGDINVSAPQ